MTTLLDALAPELGRLDDASALVNGDPGRARAAMLQQLMAGELAEADALDADGAALRQALADLRAHVALLGPPPPPPPKPTGRRSGLPWASCWRHPSSYTTLVKPAFLSFEAYRGRRLDGLHVFVGGWKGRPLEQWPANSWTTAKGKAPGGTGEGVLWWLARDGIDAYLTWPLLSDIAPDGKARFQSVVDGLHDAAHSAVADQVVATGANVRVIRLGHEANMGDMAAGTSIYPWCVPYAQGDLALFRAAYLRVAALLQAKFPNALLDFNCLRQLTNVASLDDIFPGPPFRIISGEGYGTDDRIATAAGLKAFLTQGTPDLPMGAASWVAAARKRSCLYAVPEWSTAVPPGQAATRDVGDFVRGMWEHFLANADVLAWEAQFGNDSLDGTGAHSFWNPVSCPNASAAYQQAWMPRWAG